MEPVRADVDAFLLDRLEDREFIARDFGELPNGICRVAAPLTRLNPETAAAASLGACPGNPIACAMCGEPQRSASRRRDELCARRGD
jgi:hypothetical protein